MTETKVDLSKYNDFKPINPSALDMAFGASGSFNIYAPMYLGYKQCEVREKDCKRFWREVFSQMFYRGLGADCEFVPRDGIDPGAALRHIRTISGSFEPDHNNKEYIVAFLLNLWFRDFKPGKGTDERVIHGLNQYRKDLDSPVFSG